MNVNLECHKVGETVVRCERCGEEKAVTIAFSVVAANTLTALTHFDVTVCESCGA
jgi:hypothetical protein